MASGAAESRQRVYGKNAMIFFQGDKADHVLRIVQGVVRLCLYLPDGQRVVAGFAFPGDLIGLDHSRYAVTAEAVTAALLHERPPIGGGQNEEVRLISGALHQANIALAVRSRRHARARVAAFLIALVDRGLGVEFRLPMPLADLADHLGLTVHTISRTLAELRRRDFIQLARGRRLSIPQVDQLRAIANDDGELQDAWNGKRQSSQFSGMTH
ncbi:MAG TPA: Crp/Fnr family transcriptional regulator [Sphingobium sp.]|uniref:Crp/Fnr family transcriptional regulator n=1 Tax=Sphingobium sp. TaxID=1912891 RepID=UPI002ED219FD